MKARLLSASILSAALLFSSSAYAAPDSALLERIEKLEAELALLKRQTEADKEVTEAAKSKQASVELGKKGLQISSPDKNLTLGLRGYFQIDNRTFLNDDNNTGRDDILARRLRPTLEGTAFKDFSFRLMPDFAGSATRIFDAHVDYKMLDELKLRVGKFKPPVSLERLQSGADLMFVERGQANNLAPGRDFGVQLYGDLIPETLEYQLGIFNGNQDLGNSDSDSDDNKDIAARVFAHPFQQSDNVVLQGLGVGIGGSTGERDGSSTSTILGDYRTSSQQAFFRYRTGAAADTTFADGTHWRLQPQAYWYYNSLGLIAEYGITSQDVTRGNNSETLQHHAWNISGSYVLTGEDNSYKGGIKPSDPFDISSGGWGAVEVVARVGQTDIDNDAFPIFANASQAASQATNYGTGLNWYLNEHVKLWLNYELTTFDGGATTGDRPDEHVILSRIQYRF